MPEFSDKKTILIQLSLNKLVRLLWRSSFKVETE